MAVSTERFYLIHQILGADTDGILFSGSVDIRKHYLVRNRQSLGEIIQEGLGSGVCVRLEYNPKLLVLGRLGCS